MRIAVAAALAAALGASAAGAKAPPLKLHVLQVRDPVSGGIVAFRMLVPNGWSAEGGVQWNLNYSNLASVVMRISKQTAYDDVYSEFSDEILGVQSYDDPVGGGTIQLPDDYSYAWESSSGHVTRSNDGGFDPNAGSTATWHLLHAS